MKHIIIKIINTLLIIISAYLLMVSGIILDTEISCGIENIPKSAVIKLSVMFIIAILCAVSGIISGCKLDAEIERI